MVDVVTAASTRILLSNKINLEPLPVMLIRRVNVTAPGRRVKVTKPIVRSCSESYASFLFLHVFGWSPCSPPLTGTGFWQALCTLTFKAAFGGLPVVVATAMCPVGMCPAVMLNGFLLFQRYGRLLSAVLLHGHWFDRKQAPVTDTHECTDNARHSGSLSLPDSSQHT